MTAIVVATPWCQLCGSRSSGDFRRRETTGSPMAPRARLESVTPSWIDEMKLDGLSSRLSTRRARLLPCASSSCRRVRRTVTRAYSAATKDALAATITTTAKSSAAVSMDWERRRSSVRSIEAAVAGPRPRARGAQSGGAAADRRRRGTTSPRRTPYGRWLFEEKGANARTGFCRYRITVASLATSGAHVGESISCLIVDDHEVVREGLRLALSRADNIRVV